MKIIIIVDLRGLDPGSDFIAQPKNPPTTGPFSNDLLAQIKVSPEEVWGGVGTRFLHLEREFNEFIFSKNPK